MIVTTDCETYLYLKQLLPFYIVYGLIIRMFAEPGTPHNRPHFHVYYQNDAAVFCIEPIELMGGDLPLRYKRLVEAWAELHQGELVENWKLLQSGHLPYKIAPLR